MMWPQVFWWIVGLECHIWNTRLTTDPPVPRWFSRQMISATCIDQWVRDGLMTREETAMFQGIHDEQWHPKVGVI